MQTPSKQSTRLGGTDMYPLADMWEADGEDLGSRPLPILHITEMKVARGRIRDEARGKNLTTSVPKNRDWNFTDDGPLKGRGEAWKEWKKSEPPGSFRVTQYWCPTKDSPGRVVEWIVTDVRSKGLLGEINKQCETTRSNLAAKADMLAESVATAEDDSTNQNEIDDQSGLPSGIETGPRGGKTGFGSWLRTKFVSRKRR